MDSPRPTDLAQRIIAAQRKAAPSTRRAERTAPQHLSQQHQTTPTPTVAAPSSPQTQPPPPPPRPDPDHFSRLHISPSSASTSKSPKLYNPSTDSTFHIRRTTEPEQDTSRLQPESDSMRHANDSRQVLFDPRKDDPVRFAVLARGRPSPTPKSSGDASASSASQTSSVFTLSSDTTGGSSASSALFDVSHKSENTNILSNHLKRMYREITTLEGTVKQDDAEDPADEPARILIKSKDGSDDEANREKWNKQLHNHKKLAECIHGFLEISLAPSIPPSLRGIPTKYNIVVRLWSTAFHKLLESLRRASFNSPLALEHLQDFIYYAYTFYCGLLEDPRLASFKSGWLEALGDLARYKMAVCAMVTASQRPPPTFLTTAAVNAASVGTLGSNYLQSHSGAGAVVDSRAASDQPPARIDDEEQAGPSVGVAAARLMEMEPDQERWRNIAREWFSSGLADQPGTGRLHHHLGLLSREVESEEVRGIYHFVKSMTTLHPFSTSRESILPIWSVAAQSRRSLPDARVPDLFVLMHGMLFTNIQLDGFQPTLARFLERLQLEGAEEKEWTMMGIINIGAIMEYGRPTGVLRKAGVVGGRTDPTKDGNSPAQKVMITKKGAVARSPVVPLEERMDVDGESRPYGGSSPSTSRMQSHHPPSPSPANSETEPIEEDFPLAYKFALQLSFEMLAYVLKNPMRKPTPFSRSTLNPYLIVILTFLATLLKSPQACRILERSIPWDELAAFFSMVPREIMISQNLMAGSNMPTWSMLTTSCAPPLPEDWCMRGMEWVGRKVFERGYWKSGEERRVELEVLDERPLVDMTDGKIEDDDDDDDTNADGEPKRSDTWKRWVRLTRCGIALSECVDGFTWVKGTREWRVEGRLAEKVREWKEDDVLQREEEERRRMRIKWADDSMEVDDDESGALDENSEAESDDENDSEEVKELRARRRYLKTLLQTSAQQMPPSPPRAQRMRAPKPSANALPQRQLLPGYSILVFDTNVFLSMLPMVSALVESQRWTVVVPLPVVMELDGLSQNVSPQLSEVAQNALSYLTSHIRSHSISLKVQTSKGNYLTSLEVRVEQVDFKRGDEARSMDDLILKAAIWQDEHWVDRSALLKVSTPSSDINDKNVVKVALLTLDRNMRLKARSRQLYAATEKELAALLTTATTSK